MSSNHESETLSFGKLTLLFVTVIFIGSSFWIYVIDEMWFSKLPQSSQDKIQNWGIGLFLLAVFILYPMGMFGGQKWSGEGIVNIFPEGTNSKNYRLPAEIAVENKFWWQKDYTIESVEWPNSGTSYFYGCTINSDNDTCEDGDGRQWRIEIAEIPEAPSRDDY